MNITTILTMSYVILDAWRGQKTKPIQTQLKPIQTQFKANSKPIASKAKIDAKCEFTKDYEEKCGYCL